MYIVYAHILRAIVSSSKNYCTFQITYKLTGFCSLLLSTDLNFMVNQSQQELQVNPLVCKIYTNCSCKTEDARLQGVGYRRTTCRNVHAYLHFNAYMYMYVSSYQPVHYQNVHVLCWAILCMGGIIPDMRPCASTWGWQHICGKWLTTASIKPVGSYTHLAWLEFTM